MDKVANIIQHVSLRGEMRGECAVIERDLRVETTKRIPLRRALCVIHDAKRVPRYRASGRAVAAERGAKSENRITNVLLTEGRRGTRQRAIFRP